MTSPAGGRATADRRVLHVSQPVDAGVATVVSQLVAHQVDAGWVVAVACPTSGSLADLVSDAGGTVLPWSATREPGPSVLWETARLRGLVNRWCPDVVHLHSSKAGLAGRLALRGRKPTIFQPHAWSFLAVSGAVRAASIRWERFAARWTDIVVCVSLAELAAGESEHIRASWRVCSNGIDLTRFRPPTAYERDAVREQLGLPDELIVLCVGRLCSQKGQDLLLQAWSRLQPRTGGVLILVGEGPSRSALERAAGAGVVFVGSTSDVTPWYHAASLVVQPSRWEGASLTTREAMACGLCVVASDVAGVAEVLQPGCGGVVPVNDVDALAAAMAERLTDSALRADEGAQARFVAERDLDLSRTLSAIDLIYEKVLQLEDP